MIYSVRPDMLVLGESASRFRMEIGERLAKEEPAVADMVIGIPESGIFPATGYAAQARIPFNFGLIRDYYTRRTVFDLDQEQRLANLREKLIAVSDMVSGKRLVLIDEAVISGSTLTVAVDKLKKAGAKEIHIRIPSPLMLSNCHNGVLNESAPLIVLQFGKGGNAEEEKRQIEDGLAQCLGVDSLRFLSVGSFMSISSNPEACAECFKYNQ